MNLVIAEKDMLARDIARAMCGIDVAEDARLPISGNGFCVVAASGHLLELDEPAAIDPDLSKWEIGPLPIAFDPWPKSPKDERSARRLETIGRLLSECDGAVFCAGDADDEGQLIVDEILGHLGYDPADERFLRVYVNDNLEPNIRRAFEKAVPNAGCMGAGRAALARQMADMCFGVNESRLATKRLGALVTVGRVQTPTLALVVARDLEREAHVQRTAYSLELACEAEGGLRISFSFSPPAEQLEDGTRCFDRGYLEGIAERFGDAVFEADFSVSERKSAPPLPYSMDTLVADMSARFKMTATEVMEATQKLRDDHHAITYNRSPVPYLKEEHFNLAPTTSATVQMCLGTSFELAFERKTSAFDDSKCGAHHGIIPQDVLLDVRSLPEREALVYEAVAMRYLAQFMGAQAYSEATAAVSIEGLGGTLKHSSKVLGEPGWAALCPSRWAKVSRFEERIPDAGTARVRVIESSISEKKTEPPKAFTDGTLVSAMSRISRYVGDPETRRILEEKDSNSPGEHGSIGTVATRAQIVESLVSRGYLERKKASLVSTDKGRAFIELLPPDLAGVDLTARWYLLQKKVEAGELPPSCVMEDVCERFEERRDRAYEGKTLVPAAGPCPVCGGSVVSRGRAWSCSSNIEERDENGSFRLVSGCGFKILPFCGKSFSAKQVSALLSGRQVALRGCLSKDGRKFDCKLGYDAKEKKVIPSFDRDRRGSGKGVLGR